MKDSKVLLTALAGIAFSATSLNAAVINGDFQADVVNGNNNTLVPAGWTHTGSGDGIANNESGVRDDGPLTDATRDQFFFSNQDQAGNSALLFQMTTIEIVEGFTYTLTADVGEQGNQPDDDLGRIGIYGSTLGTGTAFSELDNIDPGTNGQSTWNTFQTQFTATAAQAGQTLGVYLGFGSITESGALNVSYDNVVVTVIPEPGSLALLGLGGLLVAPRRRACL